MGRMKDMYIDLCERILDEVRKGFDTRDEMKEVFLEIADDFQVPSDYVWKTYYEGDWQ